MWITPTTSQNNVAISFPTKDCVPLSYMKVYLWGGVTPQTDTWLQVCNGASTFHLLSQWFEKNASSLFSWHNRSCWQNFKSLSFHPCHEHIRNPLCKNLLISKNNNKVTHVFLWNANFDGNFWLIWRFSLIFPFNQFINLVPTKYSDYCHRLSNSLSITKFGLPSFAIFPPHGPVMHSAHINTIITLNNLQKSMTFGWSNALYTQELNHSKLLNHNNKCSLHSSHS